MQLESAALRDFKPADDSSGESNHTVHARRDAFLENCFFYISRLYEFLHSLGQTRQIDRPHDARVMSASRRSLPKFGAAANRRDPAVRAPQRSDFAPGMC